MVGYDADTMATILYGISAQKYITWCKLSKKSRRAQDCILAELGFWETRYLNCNVLEFGI